MSRTMKLAIFLGTRPEIIKLAPLIELLNQKKKEFIIIHSGQHYDLNMSKIFFEELSLPSPDYNIAVGSDSHGEQTGKILIEFERILQEELVDIAIAEGDTNTVLASGLAASKLGISFAHIEAGLRSFDITMPEELNRRLAASCANIHFAPTKQAALNLLFEGISPTAIHVVGNTVVDAVQRHQKLVSKKGYNIQRYSLDPQETFILMTLHRAENVDDKKRLENILSSIKEIKSKTLFLIHPRTQKRINEFELMGKIKNTENLIPLAPVGYFELLFLLQRATLVLTDSGGLQEEAITLQIPCATLRTTTD
ncbi:MAG: non-hydrolyzing UDP-N-acetylglucosamine 2-epimerase, partial [Candidatus Hodarchaeota archaeon]